MTAGIALDPEIPVEPRRIDIVLALTVAIGAASRFVAIGAQSLWYDEVATWAVVTRPIAGLLTRVGNNEGTPHLYFVLTAGWTRVFGFNDSALRSFSAVVGTLTIPLVYATVREFGLDRRIARTAAALIAVNPFLVWYSQEARAYSLLVFVAAISMLAFARALRRGRAADFWCFGGATALALATHYFAIFLVLPQIVALLIAQRRAWRQVVAGLLPLLVVMFPLGLLALEQQSHDLQEWIGDWPLTFRLRESARHLLIGPAPPRAWLWTVVAVAGLIGLGLAVTARDGAERRTARTVSIIGMATAFLPWFAALAGRDYFLDRNVIAALVPLTIAVAIGLGGVRARWVGRVALAGVLIVSLSTTIAIARDEDLQRADWRSITEEIVHHDGPQVIVMNAGRVLSSAMFRYLPPAREVRGDTTIRTREIVFIGLGRVPVHCAWWFGRSCSIIYLSEKPQAPLSSAFRLVQTDTVGRFLVARFRSDSPVRVRPDRLVAPHEVTDSLVILTSGR